MAEGGDKSLEEIMKQVEDLELLASRDKKEKWVLHFMDRKESPVNLENLVDLEK